MAHGTSRLRIFDSIGLGMGVAAMLVAAGAVFGDRTTNRRIEVETIGSIHKCTFPIIEANAPPGCEAEAAGYAAALVTLQMARANADDAYLEWYRCLNGGQNPVVPVPPKPKSEAQNTVSVLEP